MVAERRKKIWISKAHPTPHPTPPHIGLASQQHPAISSHLSTSTLFPFSQLAVSPLNDTSCTYGKLQHHNIPRAVRRAQEDLHPPHYRLYVNTPSHPFIPAVPRSIMSPIWNLSNFADQQFFPCSSCDLVCPM